ncbi:hypothetical protein TNCV_1338521 [Trichonephila clavipes]|nr:hypothetical protein TNCV_1338521 [Trichonephila clavipes]
MGVETPQSGTSELLLFSWIKRILKEPGHAMFEVELDVHILFDESAVDTSARSLTLPQQLPAGPDTGLVLKFSSPTNLTTRSSPFEPEFPNTKNHSENFLDRPCIDRDKRNSKY